MKNPIDWGLTPREHTLMQTLVEHIDGKRTGRALGISPRTVECYAYIIIDKMGVPRGFGGRYRAIMEYDRWQRRARFDRDVLYTKMRLLGHTTRDQTDELLDLFEASLKEAK